MPNTTGDPAWRDIVNRLIDQPTPAGATTVYDWEDWYTSGTSSRLFDITTHNVGDGIEVLVAGVQFSDGGIASDIRVTVDRVDCFAAPLTVERARQLAAVLLDAADRIERLAKDL